MSDMEHWKYLSMCRERLIAERINCSFHKKLNLRFASLHCHTTLDEPKTFHLINQKSRQTL